MKQVYYKGFIIYERDNGWWELFEGGQSVRFDSLSHAKHKIDYWTK